MGRQATKRQSLRSRAEGRARRGSDLRQQGEGPTVRSCRGRTSFTRRCLPRSRSDQGQALLVVASGPLTSLPFHVLVTKTPPKARPSQIGRLRKRSMAQCARHSITVLPSVVSLKALRQYAKTSRADKPFHRLRQSPSERPERQRQARLGAAGCKTTACHIARSPAAGFAPVSRNSSAAALPTSMRCALNIHFPRRPMSFVPWRESLASRRRHALPGRQGQRKDGQGAIRRRHAGNGTRRPFCHPWPACRRDRDAGRLQGRAGADPDPAARRRARTTTACSPHPRSRSSSSMPTGSCCRPAIPPPGRTTHRRRSAFRPSPRLLLCRCARAAGFTLGGQFRGDRRSSSPKLSMS